MSALKLPPTFKQVVCLECGHEMSPSLTRTACEKCGAVWLDARYDYEAVARRWPKVLRNRRATLWRYEELLPLSPDHAVTMREGWSPLLHAEGLGRELGHKHLYIKDERQSPTSSFKDRQAALAVSALRATGAEACVLASTGNAAAAYAAYCARAGIKLWVFVTSQVPVEKMRETALYGAEVIKVTGTYDQTKEVAASFARRHNLPLDRGAKGVPGKEAMKTIAFEIAEQLNWKAPDWYVQAVSGGIGPIGVWKGFTELKRMGLIDRLPRLAIIQSEGCNPMVRAFRAGKEKADPVTPHTAITILATGDPGFGYTLLYRAATGNGGTMTDVSDEEAFRALRRLARTEGFSVEPATAVAFAGLEKLLQEGVIKPDETVVVNASGHTLPVEKFIIGDRHHIIDIEINSKLAERWGMPEEGLNAALEHLDEKITSVVVIDDNPRDSRLIRRLLQRHRSYRVFEANNAEEGIELVRERRPDLVILDLLMPGKDGFDVLETLKKDRSTARIPVIIVSAKNLSEQERRRLEGQALSVWTKGSYDTHQLVEHVVTTLGDRKESLSASDENRDASGKQTGEKTILVVEDNPLDGRLLRRTLEKQKNLHVVEAHSGEQALLLLRQQPPDLIILDLVLPDMSGFDILEHLRVDPETRDIPVIVLTAKELSDTERAQLEKQAKSTWIKGDLDRSALREQINDVIS
ncbi:MAG TPA: threonine synthase [Chloroflexi bacterium]|nr:threonine synthase [Chloroflexota bacterium]